MRTKPEKGTSSMVALFSLGKKKKSNLKNYGIKLPVDKRGMLGNGKYLSNV